VAAGATAALLAGCNGGPLNQGVAPSAPYSVGALTQVSRTLTSTFVGTKAPAIPQATRTVPLSPAAAKTRKLFFASTGGYAVLVFSLPSMILKATLSGFAQPQGLCTDAKGDVWVANTGTNQMIELSHAGVVINTIDDAYGHPVGCAVDPASGNLAVTNIYDFSGGGHILVYTSPSSPPKLLQNPAQYHNFFAAYGPKSTLWVSGLTSSGSKFILSKCNTSSCTTVNLTGGTLYFPGAVQRDTARHQWVIFDQSCNNTTAACSYPVSSNGTLGSPTIYTNSSGGQVCDLVQAALTQNGTTVLGGDYEYCGRSTNEFDVWAYPAGGSPTNFNSNPDNPLGAAISSI